MNNDLEQFDIERLKEMLDEDINPLDGFSSVPNYWLHDFARMALAAKQAKPVAWGTLQQEFLDEDRSLFTDQDEANAYSESCYGLTPLYTTPQPAHAEQDGWKLVPIEPTIEMREAFHNSYKDFENCIGECPDSQWKAMIAAAPKPESE